MTKNKITNKIEFYDQDGKQIKFYDRGGKRVRVEPDENGFYNIPPDTCEVKAVCRAENPNYKSEEGFTVLHAGGNDYTDSRGYDSYKSPEEISEHIDEVSTLLKEDPAAFAEWLELTYRDYRLPWYERLWYWFTNLFDFRRDADYEALLWQCENAGPTIITHCVKCDEDLEHQNFKVIGGVPVCECCAKEITRPE